MRKQLEKWRLDYTLIGQPTHKQFINFVRSNNHRKMWCYREVIWSLFVASMDAMGQFPVVVVENDTILTVTLAI